MRIAFVSIMLLASTFLHAEIYQCVDSHGKIEYSDQKCSEKNSEVQVVDPKVNVVPFKDVLEIQQTDSRSIYKGSRVGRKSRFLNVSIYEETDTYIIFKVDAYYSGPVNGRAEFRVMPNIHWQARSFSTSEIGVSSGFARVQLSSKAKDGDTSDVITLQLWQYTPGKSAKILETKVVPYKKTWRKVL